MKKWTIKVRRRWPKVDGVLVADTEEKCHEALEILKAQDVVGVDTEYYGFKQSRSADNSESPVGKAKAISVQFAGTRGPRIFLPLWSGEGAKVNPQGRIHLLNMFKPYLESSKYEKVFHNAKADMHVLANYGITLRGLAGDTMIMDYLWANGERFHALKAIMRRVYRNNAKPIAPYTADDARDYGEVFRQPRPLKRLDKEGNVQYGKSTFIPSIDEVVKTPAGIKKLITYSVKDPFFTVVLFKFLRQKLQETPWTSKGNYWDYYHQFELPYTNVLFKMERRGAPLDVKHLEKIRGMLVDDIEETHKNFFRACVSLDVPPSFLEKFNMGSGPQVGVLLFDHLKIASKEVTKGGARSTSKRVLALIASKANSTKKKLAAKAHICALILQHRKLSKLHKTYVVPLLKCAAEYKGRVHTTYKQAGTSTGRLSSSAPNLQNVPTEKEGDVYQLRRAFIAANDNSMIGDIDLSQIEVRLTAHFTKDAKLIELLLKGWDQHLIAMVILYPQVRKWLGKRPPDKQAVKDGEEHFGKATFSEWRRRAKVLNFGIIYGMGPQGYVLQVGGDATKEEGKKVITAYFKGFPGLAFGIERIRKECYARGYVRTYLQRYCEIPEIRSQDFKIKAGAQRRSFNFVVQGSARDVLMLGMLLCDRCPELKKLGVKMLIQVHDELVFTMPRSSAARAKALIEGYVSSPYAHFGFKPLVVPTPADFGVGDNWELAKKAA